MFTHVFKNVYVVFVATTATLIIIANLFLYYQVPVVDSGCIKGADDGGYTDRAEEIVNGTGTVSSIFQSHRDHVDFMSGFIYIAMYILFGKQWFWYSLVILVGHMVFSILTALIVYKYGKSKVISILIAIIMSTSLAMLHSAITCFADFAYHTMVFIGCQLLILFWDKLSIKPVKSFTFVVMLFIVSATSSFSSGGVIVLPLIGLLALSDIVLNTDHYTKTGPRVVGVILSNSRQIVFFICSVAMYSVILLVHLYVYNKDFPGAGYGGPSSIPYMVRVSDFLNMCLYTVFAPFQMIDHAQPIPDIFRNNRLIFAVINIFIFLISISCSAYFVYKRRANRKNMVYMTCFFIMLLIACLIENAGRSFLYWWHYRYTGYGIMFAMFAVGIATSVVVNSMKSQALRKIILILILTIGISDMFYNWHEVRVNRAYKERGINPLFE